MNSSLKKSLSLTLSVLVFCASFGGFVKNVYADPPTHIYVKIGNSVTEMHVAPTSGNGSNGVYTYAYCPYPNQCGWTVNYDSATGAITPYQNGGINHINETANASYYLTNSDTKPSASAFQSSVNFDSTYKNPVSQPTSITPPDTTTVDSSPTQQAIDDQNALNAANANAAAVKEEMAAYQIDVAQGIIPPDQATFEDIQQRLASANLDAQAAQEKVANDVLYPPGDPSLMPGDPNYTGGPAVNNPATSDGNVEGAGNLMAGAVGPAVSALEAPEIATDKAEGAAQTGTTVPVQEKTLEDIAAKTAAHTGAQTTKAFSLDGIAKMIAERMVHQIATSIVQWINRGFKGGPSFVTDLKGFMQNISNTVTTTFITQSGLLQTPYGPMVAQAILSAQNSAFNPNPNFTGALSNTTNLNSFLGGNFYAGGMNGFYQMSQNPQNNAMGLFLTGNDRLDSKISQEQALAQTQLGWSSGFQSKTTCDQRGPSVKKPDGTTTPGPCLHTSVVTPGSVIRDSLNQALGSDLVTLENVHDINEIINALMGQLMNFAVTGLNGLSGASQPTQQQKNKNGTIQNVSIIDQINGGTDLVTLAQTRNPGLALIDENLAKAKDPNRGALYTGALSTVNQTGDLVGQLTSCYQNELDPSFDPPLSDSDKSLAQTRIDEAGVTFSTTLEPVKTALEHEISIIDTKANSLQQIRNALVAATTVSDINNIINSYQSQYSNTGGTLEDDMKNLTDQINSVGADIQSQLDECNALSH
ncbi:MAG: hypothetical protein PHV42_02045 [Candidatus Pacebacteria bacterium]|nr:hypothetical protein [Candidatus Paceibacterota bacterium]